ncbi:hypothetical protein BB558_004468 [Smittium angustum]|uniref:J domain-containing protein n=2 Tax=Harpellales TaxID=61421 RepID=A0A2U1J3C1_SMIAN|nr:hypothetical protein BB558_004468 [Smittium angustum]
MANYNYDESGITFKIFAFTILAVFVIPSTIIMSLKGDAKAKSKGEPTTLKLRTKKIESSSKWTSTKFRLLLVGWVLLSILGASLRNIEIKNEATWDPYEILGIDNGSDMTVIKRAYRKLSLKYHPDKVKDTNKEEAEKVFIEINRAHKTLTDDTARENYEKYGNPDGLLSRTMGIALPKFIVEAHASPFVMALYGLIIGFILPYYVGRWWYSSSRYTKDNILNPTMISFFKNIREPISQRNLIDLLCSAEEFNSGDIAFKSTHLVALKDLEDKVQAASQAFGLEYFERSDKFLSDSTWKAKVLMYAHFYRVDVDDDVLLEHQQYIIEKSIHLTHRGLIQISSAQGWAGCTTLLIYIMQMLVQGVHEHAAPLSQLPYLKYSDYLQLATKYNLYGVHQAKLLEPEKKKEIFSDFNGDVEEMVSAVNSYPQIQITHSVISVIGDSVITPFSIATLIIKIKVSNPTSKPKDFHPNAKLAISKLDSLDETNPGQIEEVYNIITKIKPTSEETPEAISPYLAAKKTSNWWFILSNPLNSRNVIPPMLISDLVTEKIFTVQFQAPQSPGTYDFLINVLSDSYVGCDQYRHIKMVVVDPSTLPPEPEIDDDISEPEESSLAAQLAEARGKAPGKGSRDDFDSSDED